MHAYFPSAVRPLPQKPINSSSFMHFHLTCADPRSNLNVGSHIPSYKTRHTSHIKGFFIQSIYTRITTPFHFIFCPFLSQGQKPFNHNQYTFIRTTFGEATPRNSSRTSTSVLLQGFLLLNLMFTHVIYFYVKPL